MEPVVTIDRLREGPPALVADLRWYLDGRPGRAAYEAGHLPGAVYVDVEADLSRHDLPPTEGRHPFPTAQAFSVTMGRLGIGDEVPVVAYDDSGGGTAARLVWMLRILGHDAALLDGGLQAWDAELETGPGVPRPAARFTPRPWPLERFVTADEIARLATSPDAVVFDARAAERYRGETEPVDPRAGHIPGARNLPWTTNLDPVTARFRPAAELASVYADAGANSAHTIVCYCGSGVSACADLLGLERAGFGGARLFVASWSGWSNNPERKVATGDRA